MTGRTHDLAAFSAASFVFVNYPPESISLATLVTSGFAVFLGGLFPDLDNASADFWEKIPGGSLIGKLIAPLLGGHRMISHSLIGVFLTGFLLDKLLFAISGVLLVDMTIVFWAFMVGYISHLAGDSLTKEGIPLFFPLPFNIGFPPLRLLRIETGGRMEKYLIYPGLMLATGYLYMQNYRTVINFLQNNLH